MILFLSFWYDFLLNWDPGPILYLNLIQTIVVLVALHLNSKFVHYAFSLRSVIHLTYWHLLAFSTFHTIPILCLDYFVSAECLQNLIFLNIFKCHLQVSLILHLLSLFACPIHIVWIRVGLAQILEGHHSWPWPTHCTFYRL